MYDMYDESFMGSNTHKQIVKVKNLVEKQGEESVIVYTNYISKGGFSLQNIIEGDD